MFRLGLRFRVPDAGLEGTKKCAYFVRLLLIFSAWLRVIDKPAAGPAMELVTFVKQSSDSDVAIESPMAGKIEQAAAPGLPRGGLEFVNDLHRAMFRSSGD